MDHTINIIIRKEVQAPVVLYRKEKMVVTYYILRKETSEPFYERLFVRTPFFFKTLALAYRHGIRITNLVCPPRSIKQNKYMIVTQEKCTI